CVRAVGGIRREVGRGSEVGHFSLGGLRGSAILASVQEAPLMTRMTRELSLVLLGAGILSAAYFFWPEEDPARKAEEQTRPQVGGNGGPYAGPGGRYVSHGFIYFPIRGGAVTAPHANAMPRGGFGAVGRGMSGVS